MKMFSSRIRGFSLLELMVVMLIIGIVAAFVVPAASGILKGSQLVQASQTITDQFSLARQYALSTNHPVELRLIQYADPEVPGEVVNGNNGPGSGNYRAVQIVQNIDTTDSQGNPLMKRIALDKPQILPQSIIMDQSQMLSTLIYEAKSPGTSSGVPNPSQTPLLTSAIKNIDPSLPRNIGYNYQYVSFRFQADGSTNLPARSASDTNGCWFVTLRNINDVNPSMQGTTLVTGTAGGSRAVNFFTLSVDPTNGATKQFRPGLQ
jgi:uncharacterized protein (TIGR02596 family)